MSDAESIPPWLDQEPLLVENNHNVYIIGAGFSARAGLPLVRTFLDAMRDSHPWLVDEERDREAAAVKKVLQYRLRSSAAAYNVQLDLENIEELFSLESTELASEESAIRLAIAATIDFCQTTRSPPELLVGVMPRILDKFKERVVKQHGFVWSREDAQSIRFKPYEYFVGSLCGIFQSKDDQRDTFISFNYDSIIENALRGLRMPYSLGLRSNDVSFAGRDPQEDSAFPRLTMVLKLHGSVTWAHADDQRMHVFDSYSELRARNLTPALLPPTWKKDLFPQISSVWKSAIQALRTATRIIVIGFSYPSTDLHFKYLLACGLSENISLRDFIVLNPDPESVKGRFGELLRLGTGVTRAPSFLRGALESVCRESGFMSRIARRQEDLVVGITEHRIGDTASERGQ